MLQHDEPWNHYSVWKKPDTKDLVAYDSIHVKYSEEADPQKWKVD
jgi:hypothetical protein